jgi:hypothetical protein
MTGENLSLSMCEIMKALELLWSKLKGETRDWAPSIMGKKTGLMGRIMQEMDKQILNFTWNLIVSFTNSHFVEKL